MAKSLKTIVIETAETLGWKVSFETQRRRAYNGGRWDKEVTDKYVEFSQFSPAGEDFSFTVFYDRLGEIPKLIYDVYDDFDGEDHVKMWLEAKDHGAGGVPGIYTLVEDAIAIEKMIIDLSDRIRWAFGRRCIW